MREMGWEWEDGMLLEGVVWREGGGGVVGVVYMMKIAIPQSVAEMNCDRPTGLAWSLNQLEALFFDYAVGYSAAFDEEPCVDGFRGLLAVRSIMDYLCI